MNRSTYLVATLAAGLGGLCLLATSGAREKPKVDPIKPAARADAATVLKEG